VLQGGAQEDEQNVAPEDEPSGSSA
jgi:hypothetical protein